MAKCHFTGKQTQFGRRIRFQGRGSSWLRRAPKTNREFRPNLQKKKMFIDGKWQKVWVSTRYLRTEAKHMQQQGAPYEGTKAKQD